MLGPFFYDERQSVPNLDSFSPSAGKPARFMELMLCHHRTAPRLPVTPITRDDLYLVHDRDYVDGVFEGREPNGFGNYDARVPQACLWTIGSLVSAALYAPSQPLAVCSPTSGFHHAGFNYGGGYCTFNGLMVAAAKFTAANPGSKVGILDLDFHFADGSLDILKHKPELAKQVIHRTSGEHFHDGDDPDEFFLWLEESIAEINAFGCDVVLYQAGADMHIKDPLGGLLDDAQMAQRDRSVIRKVRGGLVWNLAGGYRGGDSIFSDPVLQTHRNTIGEANASDGARRRLYIERHGKPVRGTEEDDLP